MGVTTFPGSSVEDRAAKVNAAVSRIVDMFTSGDLPAKVAQTVIRQQTSDAPSARWSLGNRLLMLAAGTDDARGYDQWKQVGRHVVKGAKAFSILGPRTVKVKETDADGTEREAARVVGFFTIPVFAVEATDGQPLTQPDYRPAVLPPLFDVAQRLGIAVRWAPLLGDYRGCYYPGRNAITLCTHDAVTFFHELAHAAHNTFRPLRGGQHVGQEVVAETVAAVLCSLYGFEGFIWHGAQYVAAYAGENAGKAVMKVLADVQKCLDVILEAHEAAEAEAAD